MGRIRIGPVAGHHELDPGASAFWIAEWSQHDLQGTLVPTGEYLVEVQYRWRYSDDDEDVVPVHFQPARVVIAEEGCH